MKVMIDTNIILDVLLERPPFYHDSKAILALCEKRKIEGFITASAITDLFYITRKALGNIDETYNVIGLILNLVRVLTVSNEDVLTAFQQKAHDFEDCLMATCAKSNHCKGIISRNRKDFIDFGISLYSPEEFLKQFCSE